MRGDASAAPGSTLQALPAEHRRARWLFAAGYLTICVAWLLLWLEPLRRGEPSLLWPFRLVDKEDGGWIVLLFAGLVLVNVWSFDGVMELATRQEGRTRLGVRAVRLLVAGVPLIGVLVMPIWLWVLDRKPAWAVLSGSSAGPPPNKRLLVFFSSRTQLLRLSVPFFGALMIGNILLCGAGVAWLGASRVSWFGIRAIDHVAWMLRVFGVLGGLIYVTAQHAAAVPLRVPRSLPWVLPLLWLLPSPGCMAGVLVPLVFNPLRRTGTLVQGAFEGRQSVGSLLIDSGRFDWWKLSVLQRIRWPSGRSPAQPAEAANHLDGFRRVKTFLLSAESALLTALLVTIPWGAPLAQVVDLLLNAALGYALASVLVGAALVVFTAVRQRGTVDLATGPPPGRESWAVVLVGLAVATGVLTGRPIGRGDTLGVAVALWNIGRAGMLGVAVVGLLVRFGPSRVGHRPLRLMAWLLTFAGIAYAGFWIGTSGRAAPWTLPVVFALLSLAPIASLLIGVVSSRWLLHPFTLGQIRKENLALQWRLALAFLVATAWAPGGGLAVPLWPAVRRRLWSLAAQLPVQEIAEVPSAAKGGSRLFALTAAQRAYVIRHLVAHQAAGGAESLFHRIESSPFFAEQARGSGGFGRGSEDIEGHILPLVRQSGDWDRFLRYGSLAIHLRRMSDDFAEPDLLAALMRHGHRRLAYDAAARLADPAQRALGWAALAAAADGQDPDRETLLGHVRDDLALLAPIDDPEPAEARFVALFRIGLHLGPVILPALQRIPPGREGQEPRSGLLAFSVAAGALQRKGGLDAEAWQILRSLPEEEIPAQFLPDLLGAAAATTEPDRLLERLTTLSLRPEALWACRLSILASQARSSPEAAARSWKRVSASPPLPWSVALIESGAPLFATLPEEEISGYDEEIADPIARAALRVVILERRHAATAEAAARAAVARLPPGPKRFHWSLRLAAASRAADESRQEEVRALGRQLFERQHQAPFEDLRRYLELVACWLPNELRRRAEDVILSTEEGLPLLFHLAGSSTSRAVLENLVEEGETYLSSMVGLPELQGLRFWCELLHELTARLCVVRRDLTALDDAMLRFPEMDSLAARASRKLAEAGEPQLAAEAAARIRSGRVRLTTRLRWLPDEVTSSGGLELEALYGALASVAELEDEWLGLAALHDPSPPEILFQRYFDRIADRDTQVLAVFRLARRVLGNSRAPCGKAKLVLQMLGQALGAMQSDARLAALTPWLPEMAARVDPALAIEEYRRAFARLLGLHTVFWHLRRDSLERLLVQLACVFCATDPEDFRRMRSVAALFEDFERVLAEGVTGQEESVVADLLPALAATLDRLPATVARCLARPFGSRLHFLDAESEQIRCLCQSSLGDRIQSLEAGRKRETPFRLASAHCYLLVRERPEHVLGLLDQLPGGPQRDDLCRRLVTHEWVKESTAVEVTQRIDDSGVALEAKLLATVEAVGEKGELSWMESLVSRLEAGGLDPSEPAWASVIERIWSIDPRLSRPALAEAVLAALGREAPQTAETALRWWLHAHLSPCHRRTSCAPAFAAIRAALLLSPRGRVD